MSAPFVPSRLFRPVVFGLSLLLVVLPVALDAAPAARTVPTQTAPPDSSRAAPTPIYRKKGVLIGAAVALVGVLALVLGGGESGGASPPGDDGLPGFPPPPSSRP